MKTGSVKWFNNAKGYGFIIHSDLDEDIFVHYSQIQEDGFKTLREGETVDFELDLVCSRNEVFDFDQCLLDFRLQGLVDILQSSVAPFLCGLVQSVADFECNHQNIPSCASNSGVQSVISPQV